MGQAYANHEKMLAQPVADALQANSYFRSWVLRQTKFAAYANEARLLNVEMLKLRTASAANWWVSHFHYGCDCFGCKGGKETDLLAIFDAGASLRFALHFEIKRPGDQFRTAKKQPEAYKLRATCWTTKPPTTILPHQDAETILICSPTRVRNFEAHIAAFDRSISIEQINEAFPNLLPE